MALFITEAQVDKLLTMEIAMDALEEIFKARAVGDAYNMPRRRLPTGSGAYNFMAATWRSHGIAGHKSYAVGAGGISFHVMLYDTTNNRLKAVIEANRMGQIRTGAASGVATKYMANEAKGITVGIIGSGYQAETQLEALMHARVVKDAKVYSRSPENRNRYAELMSTKLGIEVRPVDSAEDAADAEIVATMASSVEPVLQGAWVHSGIHINAAGNNSWMKSEIDARAVALAEIVAVDDLEQAKIECGELMRAAETGHFSWDKAIPIHEIVGGARSGRDSAAQVTLFESQGIALEDIAVCERIYDMAVEQGAGTELSF